MSEELTELDGEFCNNECRERWCSMQYKLNREIIDAQSQAPATSSDTVTISRECAEALLDASQSKFWMPEIDELKAALGESDDRQ